MQALTSRDGRERAISLLDELLATTLGSICSSCIEDVSGLDSRCVLLDHPWGRLLVILSQVWRTRFSAWLYQQQGVGVWEGPVPEQSLTM